MKEATIFLLGFLTCIFTTHIDAGKTFRCTILGDCVTRGIK